MKTKKENISDEIVKMYQEFEARKARRQKAARLLMIREKLIIPLNIFRNGRN